MRHILLLVVSVLATLASACEGEIYWGISCGPQAPGEQPGLNQSRVVCRTCSEEDFFGRAQMICAGLRQMVAAVGDVEPEQAPVTFHLDIGGRCGDTTDWTGGVNIPHADKGVGMLGWKGSVCLYQMEFEAALGQNYDPELIKKIEFRITIHEAAHIWFAGRFSDKHAEFDHNHSFEETLADLLGLQITNEVFPKDTSCDDLRTGQTKGNPTLWSELCTLGLRLEQVPEIFRRIAADSAARGRRLIISEVEAIITEVVGADLSPAFEAARQRRKEAGG